MRTIILAFFMGATLSFGSEIQIIDTSMAAPQKSDLIEYEERVSVGAYLELSSIDSKAIEYEFKIMNRPYDLSFSSSNFYGLSGNLPLNSWVGLYALGGYQYVEVKYKDKNTQEGYQNLASLIEENPFFSLDSSAVEGHFDAHRVSVQFGFEAGFPLLSSYNYQTMLKVFGFLGGVGGRVFYRNTDFMNAAHWGYAWGGGFRAAYEKLSVSFGFRSSHLYSRTYFEKPSLSNKTDDTFMADISNFGQLFVSASVSLF